MKLLKGFFLLAFVAVLSISCNETKKETKQETKVEVVKKCKKDCKKSCCVVAEKKCCTTKKCKDSCTDKGCLKCVNKQTECKAKCEAKMTKTEKDSTCCKSKK